MRFLRIRGILFHNMRVLTSPWGAVIDLFKARWNWSISRSNCWPKTTLKLNCRQSCFYMTLCISEWLPAPVAENHGWQWTFSCTLQWWNILPLISYRKWQYSWLPFSGTPTRVIWISWLFVCLLARWYYMIRLPVGLVSNTRNHFIQKK